MDRNYISNETKMKEWAMSNPTVIDYGHQPPLSRIPELYPLESTWQTQSAQLSSFGPQHSVTSAQEPVLYNPFVEDDMDISDEENKSKKSKKSPAVADRQNSRTAIAKSSVFAVPTTSQKLEVTSGAAFYKGLILYIPPLDTIVDSDKHSSAIKMLFASFDFSFKTPMKIEVNKNQNNPNATEAVVSFEDNVILKDTIYSSTVHNEISMKALELLSETCYTIQAKDEFFRKCTLIDASNMKTLNLKKWEALSEKYPKLPELTKQSHIQKTISVFLDIHTSSGVYEDIVCCNLTRNDVRDLKCVIDFFHLTMLPCCVMSNLSKDQGPCVVTIHKYTSAKNLLQILVESGGENDRFRLHPPDTFKDFYKLHPHYWDPSFKNARQNKILKLKTTLAEEEIQSAILNPYENTIAELFEKHKALPIVNKQTEDTSRQTGDDFMKDNLKIDMAHSNNVAPVERMQLLLKYMEQLQEYGSRVLNSGRPEMIKIYHSAIENLRKDLDTCSKDIEKEQKEKTNHRAIENLRKDLDTCSKEIEKEKKEKTSEKPRKSSKTRPNHSRSPNRRRRTPPKVRKSPNRQHRNDYSRKRSASPRKRTRSKSPRKRERRRSASVKRNARPVSPRRRPRSRSPRARPLRSSPPRRVSPPRRARSSRSRSPNKNNWNDNEFAVSIFQHQFKIFMESLRRNGYEIENTPNEQRILFMDKLHKYQEQLKKFYIEAVTNKLDSYLTQIGMCQDELMIQDKLISGTTGAVNTSGYGGPPAQDFNSPHFHIQRPPLMYGNPNVPQIPGYRMPFFN